MLKCQCGFPVSQNTVKKPGPNNGKSFYGCNQYPGGCSFFQWVPNTPMAQSSASSLIQEPQLQQLQQLQHPQPQRFVSFEEHHALQQRVELLEMVIQRFGAAISKK